MLVCDETSESRTFRFSTIHGEVTLRLTATITGDRSPMATSLIEWDGKLNLVKTRGSSVIKISVEVELEFGGEKVRFTNAVENFFMYLSEDWRPDEKVTFSVKKGKMTHLLTLFNQSGDFLSDSDGLQVVRSTA